MPNSAFSRPFTPSPQLAAVIGPEPRPRTAIVADVWTYIKEHNLQAPDDKRVILSDEKLLAVFGQGRTDMFKMMGLLSPHLS
jgi:chromatin remodeling complex protein RSC6